MVKIKKFDCCLKDNAVTTLTFWGSRDVIGHVAIQLVVVDFPWMVHCDHATPIWRRYELTDLWRLKDNGVTTLTFWGHMTSSVT